MFLADRSVFLQLAQFDQINVYDIAYPAALRAGKCWEQMGRSNYFSALTSPTKHDFPPDMRILAYGFFNRSL